MIENLTDLSALRVAVDPQGMRFGHGCFACPASDGARPVPLRFTRTLILGLLGGIESLFLEAPLCAACESGYAKAMRRITIVQVGCAAVASVAFGLLFLAFENPTLKPFESQFAGIGVAAVVVAFLSIGLRARALPVRLRALQYGQIGRYGAFVFSFQHAEAARRFARANPSP